MWGAVICTKDCEVLCVSGRINEGRMCQKRSRFFWSLWFKSGWQKKDVHFCMQRHDPIKCHYVKSVWAKRAQNAALYKNTAVKWMLLRLIQLVVWVSGHYTNISMSANEKIWFDSIWCKLTICISKAWKDSPFRSLKYFVVSCCLSHHGYSKVLISLVLQHSWTFLHLANHKPRKGKLCLEQNKVSILNSQQYVNRS